MAHSPSSPPPGSRLSAVGQRHRLACFAPLKLKVPGKHPPPSPHPAAARDRLPVPSGPFILPLGRPIRPPSPPSPQVIDHLPAFKANGFEVQVQPDAPPTERLRLLTLPFSRHTVFGVRDVHELVALLAEAPGGQPRLPKLRDMFASRACRSAVMIGTALEQHKMRTIVAQLAELEQPWNCPHGRPTLRHLIDLTSLARTRAATGFKSLK